MLKLEWSTRFEKDRALIKEKLELFKANPHDLELINHKLSGQLKGLRAISVAYNCRILFAMVVENTALLVSIGTRDEVSGPKFTECTTQGCMSLRLWIKSIGKDWPSSWGLTDVRQWRIITHAVL